MLKLRGLLRRRMVPCLLLLLVAGGTTGLLTGLATSDTGIELDWSTSLNAGGSMSTPAPLPVASRVEAFYQGDPQAGWDSPQQYARWWPSACSPAALTMVLRAWGKPVQVGQVLDQLIARHAITPEHGLLHADALEQVAKAYGLQAQTFWHWTTQQMAGVVAQGIPVLVLLVDAKRQTPYPGFVVGHWLVVVRVSASQIEVRDSSGYHLRSLSPKLFQTLFTGVSVVVWQGASPLLPT